MGTCKKRRVKNEGNKASKSGLLLAYPALISAFLMSPVVKADATFFISGSAITTKTEFSNPYDFFHSGDDTTFGLGVSAGYKFHRNFAVKLGYQDFGEFEGGPADVYPGGPFERRVDIETSTYSLSMLGNIPLTDSFSLLAEVGIEHWDTAYTVRTDDPLAFTTSNFEQDGDDPFWRIGAAYRFNESFSIEIQYQRNSFDTPFREHDLDVDAVYLTASYYFSL